VLGMLLSNQVKTIPSGLQKLIEKVFTIFNKTIKPKSKVIITYSGGKDSTALAIIFYDWLERTRPEDVEVIFLHNDTLGEIPPMESWARKFMKQAEHLIGELGYEVKAIIAPPPLIDTFYWRVIVRGYPAPSYSFRWCVKLLKRDPTHRALREFTGESILMTGLRESESGDRARNIKRRYGSCSSGAGKCLAYFFSRENFENMKKIAPLRDWETIDVWAFLSLDSPFDISDLLDLYSCEGARYGCWFCTLAKVQRGLYSLNDDRYLYLDAARLLYRKISDMPILRKRKKTGYSELGALNIAGRAIMLRLFETVEKISGITLYSLDEAKTRSGFTLRELFYELPAEQAEKIITLEDPKINPKRRISLQKIKYPEIKQIRIIEKTLTKIERGSRNEKSRKLILERGFDAVKEIIETIISEF